MSLVGRVGKGDFSMSDIEKARLMQVMAHKDFNALRGMGDETFFADEIYGFHAQQAIEKSLKAWIASKSIEFPLTHDLRRLLLLIEQTGEIVEEFWPLIKFNIFSVQARYENDLLAGDEVLGRVAVLEEVRQLMSHVEAKINVVTN